MIVSLLVPSAVSPAAAAVKSYRSIAAGGGHTCAITITDRPVCWGDNEHGQTRIPAGLDAVHMVATGSFHTCAIATDGTPVCWGRNSWGQTAIPHGIGPVRQITAGHAHTCAVKVDDTPTCWGAQVPDGERNAGNHGQAQIPTDLGAVGHLSAGHAHTCAVKTDRTPHCWGGEFSLLWMRDFHVNAGQSEIPEGLGTVLQISAGREHTCAVKVDASAQCWGGGPLAPDQDEIPGDIGAVDTISAGGFHTCAIRGGPAYGTPVCWGVPAGPVNLGQAMIPPGIGDVSAISAGLLHTCAITVDGAAVCWGDNSTGQSTVPGVEHVAPVNTARPVITGTPTVGNTITASTGEWDNGPTEYAYAWLRCATDDGLWSCTGGWIPGADQPSYMLVAGDAKLHLRVMVTAKNGAGSSWQVSHPVEITPGISLPAVVRDSTTWLVRDSLTSGDATATFDYGTAPLVPITGDWDRDGSETPGTFEGGVFKMSNSIGGPPTVTVTFGNPLGFPVVGDFNGDGFDDLAVYHDGRWQFRVERGGVGNGGHYVVEADDIVFGSGNWPDTIPVAGDWDGIGGDGIGFYTSATGAWHLRQIGDGADLPPFTYWAGSGSYPVVGDWNADRTDSVGVKSGSSWHLNNQNDAGAADITFAFGQAEDVPLSWRRVSTTVFINSPPQLSIADTSVTEGDSGTTSATFTITRSGDTANASSVQWSTADGSALAPGDYLAVAPDTVTFAPGEATKTVSVTVNGDTTMEPNDGFIVILSAPTGATIADGNAVGRIVNDDSASLSVNDATVTEGDSGTQAATFTISRTGAISGAASVRWSTGDGTANAGSDYSGVAPTTVDFAAGESTKTVSVSINGDTAVEGNETFVVRLSAPVGASIADGSGLGRITNDDSATFSGQDAAVVVGDAGTTNATFTITRAGATGGSAKVAWSTENGTAAPGDYGAVAPTTVDFAAGESAKTVSVTVNGDTAVEANETFVVRLSAPVGASIVDGSGLGRITNDDSATFSVGDATVVEGDAGTTNATFTITRAGATGGPAKVVWSTENGTAVAPGDYGAVAPTTIDFAAGERTKTVSVSINGDTSREGNETLVVRLSAPVGASIVDGSGLGRITNDD